MSMSEDNWPLGPGFGLYFFFFFFFFFFLNSMLIVPDRS